MTPGANSRKIQGKQTAWADKICNRLKLWERNPIDYGQLQVLLDFIQWSYASAEKHANRSVLDAAIEHALSTVVDHLYGHAIYVPDSVLETVIDCDAWKAFMKNPESRQQLAAILVTSAVLNEQLPRNGAQQRIVGMVQNVSHIGGRSAATLSARPRDIADVLLGKTWTSLYGDSLTLSMIKNCQLIQQSGAVVATAHTEEDAVRPSLPLEMIIA